MGNKYEPGTASPWSDERVEILKTMWTAGKSASEIAGALNCGITRNAVIGKVNRLGMSGRDPSVATTNYQRAMAKARANRAASYRKPRAPKPPRPPKRRMYAAPAGPPTPPPNLKNAKTIMLRGYNECAWPIYETVEDGHLFCCAPTAGSSSYCAHHKTMGTGKALRPYQYSGKNAVAQSGRPVWSEAA